VRKMCAVNTIDGGLTRTDSMLTLSNHPGGLGISTGKGKPGGGGETRETRWNSSGIGGKLTKGCIPMHQRNDIYH